MTLSILQKLTYCHPLLFFFFLSITLQISYVCILRSAAQKKIPPSYAFLIP